MIEFLTAK